MSWRDGLTYCVRSLLRRKRARLERSEEMAFHAHMEAESLRHARRPPARVDGASPAPLADSGAATRWHPETILQDARYAVRSLRRSPAYTLTAGATLVAAIGVATATATVLSALFLRPLPFPRDEALVVLRQTDPARPSGFLVSLPNFRDWSLRSHRVADMAAWHEVTGVVSVPGADPRSVDVATTTGEFFGVMGVPALLGRTLSLHDEAGGDTVAVISFRLWREMFGSDRDVEGRVIRIDNAPATIAGVMPADFRYPSSADVWTSWPQSRQQYMPRNGITEHVIGRRAPGSTTAEVQQEIADIAAFLHVEYADIALNQATGARVVTLREDLFGSERDVLILLGIFVAFAFAMATVNLSCANLARAEARSADLNIRAALGATRPRLVQGWAVEGLVLSGLAAGIGLLAAPWLVHVIWSQAEFLSLQTGQPRIDAWSLGAAASLAVAVAAVIGVWPAWRLSRRPAVDLAGASRRTTGGNGRLRSAFIAIEVSLATLLLIAAGLATRSAVHILAQPRGFDTTHVLTADLRLPLRARARTAATVDAIISRVSALPGVTAVGTVNVLPLTADPGRSPRIASAIVATGAHGPVTDEDGAGFHVVDANYFAAMSIPLLRGRLFAPTDTVTATHVAVVSDSMARHFWPDEDPIGQHFQAVGADPALANLSLTVIGVVGDVRATSLEREIAPDYYVSYLQGISIIWRRQLVVKVAGDPAALIASVRRVMKDQAPDVPQDLMTMSARVRASVSRRLFAGTALGFTAAAGLLLVVIGVYGVSSFVVISRLREIGIRIALGASAGRVRADVLRTILGPVGIGLVVGTGAALLLGQVLQTLVFGVSPRDPLTLSLALLSVTAAATAAGLLPARRATRTDPASALRR